MSRYTDALANVYAKSLYELAEQAGGREKIMELAEELEQVCELSRANRAFHEFLSSPVIDRARRRQALRMIFADRITDLMLRFLLVLNEKGRLSHMELISDAYDRLVHEAFGRVEVDVFTPLPLEAQQQEKLKERIGAAIGKEPIIYSYTDPGMIGGLKLRIGDQLIDGSVANRLRRMRHSLLSSGTSALRERMERIIESEGGDPG